MDPLTLGELAGLVGGVLLSGDGAARIGPDVVIDSRQATPGCLFVALPGERVDGHSFVGAAAAAGAAAALVARRDAYPIPAVLVGDPQAALTELARSVVARAKPEGLQVIGITGSSGKTSTKDLLAQVLERAGETVSPVGSFNNEIGVPLTATRARAKTRFLVSEMGARGGGHVRWLCSIVHPSIAVVLNVGSAHLGEFGSPEAIAEAKGELPESVDAQGWAVLNADDHRVAAMAARTRGRVALFSVAGQPTAPASLKVWATEVRADALQRHSFVLNVEFAAAPGASETVSLRVSGAHMVSNALAAAGAAIAAGLSPDLVARSLSEATTRSRWRMELTTRADGVVLLNDAYNANPHSMRAALATAVELLAAQRAAHPAARLVAVLGDMLELGDAAAAEHRALGAEAAACGVSRLVVVGEWAELMLEGAKAGGLGGVRAPDAAAALAAVGQLAGGDVVLVKASRGVALETVAQELERLGAAGAKESGGQG